MHCDNIYFSEHAFVKMAERGIDPAEVEAVIKKGEIIKSYPDEQPDPCYLLLGVANLRVLHIVISRDVLYENCIVVTTYQPDADVWESDFKNKKIKP